MLRHRKPWWEVYNQLGGATVVDNPELSHLIQPRERYSVNWFSNKLDSFLTHQKQDDFYEDNDTQVEQ